MATGNVFTKTRGDRKHNRHKNLSTKCLYEIKIVNITGGVSN